MEISIVVKGQAIFLSETVVNTCLIAILLSIFALIVNHKIKKAKFDEAPSSFLNIVELIVEFIDKTVKDTMGEKNMKFAPFIATLMSFLVVSNLIGLLGITPPTSDYSITLSLAFIVFVLVQYYKIKTSGGNFNYLKGFTKPYVAMMPINLISEIANPISMSFRLFGNIMSGTLIMGLLYNALGYFAPLIASPLHLYFDIFVGILQAYIFATLTMVFIGGATEK